MNSLDWAKAFQDIAGAVAYLREHERGNGKVSITGFCMGGALSLGTACRVRGLAAVVPFYGVPGDQDWAKVDAPIQAHFASRDDWATPEKAKAVQAAVQAGGGSMELFVYDADHAFFNEKRPEVYSKEASEQAWKRTIEFLRAHS
jgi:carboxymethylenebutenolidase